MAVVVAHQAVGLGAGQHLAGGWIQQQLVGVVAQARGRVPGSAGAQAVHLPRANTVHVAVPDTLRAGRQPVAGNFPLPAGVKEANRYRRRVGRVDAEVRAQRTGL